MLYLKDILLIPMIKTKKFLKTTKTKLMFLWVEPCEKVVYSGSMEETIILQE